MKMSKRNTQDSESEVVDMNIVNKLKSEISELKKQISELIKINESLRKNSVIEVADNENFATPDNNEDMQFDTQAHSIKHLDHHSITWDHLRKSDLTQCKNCQRLNHTAANCSMAYRCVKCKEAHGPGNCPLEKKDEANKTNVFCALCQKYGHPANYKGCPKYKEVKLKNALIVKKDNNTNNNSTVKGDPTINRVREFPTIMPGRSFADSLKTNQPTSTNPEFTTVLGALQQQIVSIADIARQNSEKILQMFEMFQKNMNSNNHG
ncbi:unnamed protein product [Euphydryas editha]|uniref:Gag-like protein n=1 Tax=Euphydryas editha TaxID=104508 RepID=A0AAU9TLN9_EUPED|nr:unnamed protein product [Euphydryas editha]